MEGYKNVYDTRDLTNLMPLMFPEAKQVFHPFTEVEPPVGNNIIIKSFNFDTNTWQYDETVDTESYARLSMITANLMRENITIKNRLDALENPQIGEPDQPEGEGGEANVSE